MPSVSVIIPTYNRSEKLRRAIASVLAQSYRDFQVVVVDDGSSEDIAAVVDGFAGEPVGLIRHQRSRGACAARNTGWQSIDSPYIAFLDSDDVWLPKKLAKQMSVFEKADEHLGMVFTWFSNMGEDRVYVHRDTAEVTPKRLLVANMIGTVSTVVVRRAALQAVGGFDERLPACQDWDLWVRLADNIQITGLHQELVEMDNSKIRISSSKKTSIEGHRLFAEKVKNRVAGLPSAPRSRHHLNLMRVFFFKRALRDFLSHGFAAIKARPTAILDLVTFVLQRLASKTSKMFRRDKTS